MQPSNLNLLSDMIFAIEIWHFPARKVPIIYWPLLTRYLSQFVFITALEHLPVPSTLRYVILHFFIFPIYILSVVSSTTRKLFSKPYRHTSQQDKTSKIYLQIREQRDFAINIIIYCFLSQHVPLSMSHQLIHYFSSYYLDRKILSFISHNAHW